FHDGRPEAFSFPCEQVTDGRVLLGGRLEDPGVIARIHRDAPRLAEPPVVRQRLRPGRIELEHRNLLGVRLGSWRSRTPHGISRHRDCDEKHQSDAYDQLKEHECPPFGEASITEQRERHPAIYIWSLAWTGRSCHPATPRVARRRAFHGRP